MAKKISGYIKLQVPAGTANPSPPLGPALGQRGVNIMEFCKAFNAATDGMEKGTPTPTIITVFADKIARSKLTEIAEIKMKDLNANDIEQATKIIEGSARSMGLEVTEG